MEIHNFFQNSTPEKNNLICESQICLDATINFVKCETKVVILNYHKKIFISLSQNGKMGTLVFFIFYDRHWLRVLIRMGQDYFLILSLYLEHIHQHHLKRLFHPF